jgi:pyruvate dehydrogenase E2 component (dihydrolipoamide acetyltransferase)
MTHRVMMPDLGQTAAEGKIIRWLKKPGDMVAKGELLLEVETDKVTMEVESYKPGYLRALLVQEGEMASAMSAIAILTDTPEESYEGSDVSSDHTPTYQKPKIEVANPNRSRSEASSASQFEPRGRPIATPAAKARARALGLQLDRVVGTGPDCLITRRDVDAAGERHDTPRPVAAMAAITAKSTAEIPHFYLTIDVQASSLLRWRGRWNTAHPELHASVNAAFVRAAALALKEVPTLNVRYCEGKVNRRTTADILLVIATGSGLTLVPIPDPAASSWETYLSDVREALEAARENRVRGSLESSPSLAVSNLGMFGIKQFTAIIPPGCAAILAIGAIREEVTVKNQQMRVEEVCSLTLGSDHRLIDGVTAAKFLERIQAHLNAL